MAIKLGQGKVLPKGGNVNTSDIEIRLSKLSDGDSIRLRLVGDVEPGYRYWVKCSDGKTKPIITPYFDKELEKIKADDPLLGEARKEFFYTINAIDRADGQMKVLILKTTVYRSLVSLAMDEEYGNPSDETNGYDIIISKESTGPQVQNVKYDVRPGRNTTPLTDEEKALELHDLETLYKPKDESDYVEWIKLNTDVLDVRADPNSAEVNTDATTETDIPF